MADDEISVISSQQRKQLYFERNVRKQTARREWHSDITFEPIPSDYTLLRLTQLPKTGGGKTLTQNADTQEPSSAYQILSRHPLGLRI